MDIRVGVAGGGSWGTTVASLAAHNSDTMVWARRQDVVDDINTNNTNSRYLPNLKLHRRLKATTDLNQMVGQADVLVMGVPSAAMRETAQAIAPMLRPWVPVISLAKGLEAGTGNRMTEVLAEELPHHPVGVLTGPNLAKEILTGYAAAAVVSMTDLALASRIQDLFSTGLFRVYTNDDVVGSELAGALKNVIAIAAGMADGLEAGDNTRSAVITRGLAELSRLGVAMGGQPETFSGLAGMGDLVATCISSQSRNRHVGELLGQGKSLEEIIKQMDQVAEGVKTIPVVLELGKKYGVPMPITDAVAKVVLHGAPASSAYRGLIKSSPGLEMEPESMG
jgi:glycerol-3-phosphate dehydrogenase (NAD(P)+)